MPDLSGTKNGPWSENQFVWKALGIIRHRFLWITGENFLFFPHNFHFIAKVNIKPGILWINLWKVWIEQVFE